MPNYLLETNLLLNSTSDDSDLFFQNAILQGNYKAVLNSDISKKILKQLIDEGVDIFQAEYDLSIDVHQDYLCIGIASLLYFIQSNWTGPFENEEMCQFSSLRQQAVCSLIINNDQCNENVKYPELLYFSKLIFTNNNLQTTFKSSKWWLLRTNYIHQCILEEDSLTIFNETERLIGSLSESSILRDSALKSLFCTEVAQFYLLYKRVYKSDDFIDAAKAAAKLSFNLNGALGKRTKYQKEEKAILYLDIKMDKEMFPSRKCSQLPKVIDLNDDLRLENIHFDNLVAQPELGSVEESIIIAAFFQLYQSQPNDDIRNEQIIPYLNNIIENTKNWSLKMSSLFQRCILESNHKRTVERSMCQVEHLIEQLLNSKLPVSERMDSFFSSAMRPQWRFKQNLAESMLKLGMVKAALEKFLELSLWEDIIVCYTILDLKQKAIEIIKQEIDKNPTVKLWCLLGDATQDVPHYDTAWKLSDYKSSKAQRHWGLYYFSKQKYEEAIEHFKISVELNKIQESVWTRLGYAALQIEDWKLAASAYRNYCNLEQGNFEVWNNLAKAYIKLGDKPRARKCLQDAIKCNFESWEVWDNYMVVSIDLGYFSDVLQCYHRILDLKGLHIDEQVLGILVDAIINEVKDSKGNSARNHLDEAMKLFGRITSLTANQSQVWKLYANLALLKNNDINNQKAIQYYQKAFKAAVANQRWFKTENDTLNVLRICSDLSEKIVAIQSLTDKQKLELLTSAKFSVQSVLTTIKSQSWNCTFNIDENLQKTQDCLNIVLDRLNEFKIQK